MSDDGPIPGDETWLRVITRADHINPNVGQISEQALKGKALSQCIDPPDDRTHELSGRRSSLCGDVDSEAQAFIDRIRAKRKQGAPKLPKDFGHHGTAHATVEALRGFEQESVTSDVVHTPQPPEHDFPDPAHSDFILRKGTDDVLDEARTFLQATLSVSKPKEKLPFSVSQGTMTIVANTTNS